MLRQRLNTRRPPSARFRFIPLQFTQRVPSDSRRIAWLSLAAAVVAFMAVCAIIMNRTLFSGLAQSVFSQRPPD